jgi:hypothetical protein
MLEPIPFAGMVDIDLPIKTYAGDKPNYVATMTTDSLADWLENIANTKDWGELTKYYKRRLENASTMLLHQQAEIEALKALNKSIIDDPLQFMRIKAQEK